MMVTAQSMDLECRASLRTGWSILAALLLGGHMPGGSIERPAGVRAPASRAMDAGIQNSLYRELRKIAAAKMRFERGNHTLQPTALVHEAYVRLADQSGSAWHDRGRILALPRSRCGISWWIMRAPTPQRSGEQAPCRS